jgi:hypothetical protein
MSVFWRNSVSLILLVQFGLPSLLGVGLHVRPHSINASCCDELSAPSDPCCGHTRQAACFAGGCNNVCPPVDGRGLLCDFLGSAKQASAERSGLGAYEPVIEPSRFVPREVYLAPIATPASPRAPPTHVG